MWIEVAEMDAKKIQNAERNMGHATSVVVSRMKESEVMRLAREAVRDRDKFKDPETRKILKKFGLDIKSQAMLTDSMRRRATEKLVVDKSKRAGGTADENTKVRAEATVRATIPHPALLVPMTRSRGVSGCGVCTNGTGGHFAKGVGCTINGGAFNVAWNDQDGYATINGGQNNRAKGEYAVVNGGYANEAHKDDSTVCGGGQNQAFEPASTVAGGELNMAMAGGATVVGGANNMAVGMDAVVVGGIYNKASGDGGVVAGGEYNVAASLHATVVGGVLNAATHDHGTVAGGMANTASHNFSVVVGGGYNQAQKTYSVIVGGYNNTVRAADAVIAGGASNVATGDACFVAGGGNNTAAGKRSFVAGSFAHAAHQGAVVFADATSVAARFNTLHTKPQTPNPGPQSL